MRSRLLNIKASFFSKGLSQYSCQKTALFSQSSDVFPFLDLPTGVSRTARALISPRANRLRQSGWNSSEAFLTKFEPSMKRHCCGPTVRADRVATAIPLFPNPASCPVSPSTAAMHEHPCPERRFGASLDRDHLTKIRLPGECASRQGRCLSARNPYIFVRSQSVETCHRAETSRGYARQLGRDRSYR